jgi:hypothetical protein
MACEWAAKTWELADIVEHLSSNGVAADRIVEITSASQVKDSEWLESFAAGMGTVQHGHPLFVVMNNGAHFTCLGFFGVGETDPQGRPRLRVRLYEPRPYVIHKDQNTVRDVAKACVRNPQLSARFTFVFFARLRTTQSDAWPTAAPAAGNHACGACVAAAMAHDAVYAREHGGRLQDADVAAAESREQLAEPAATRSQPCGGACPSGSTEPAAEAGTEPTIDGTKWRKYFFCWLFPYDVEPTHWVLGDNDVSFLRIPDVETFHSQLVVCGAPAMHVHEIGGSSHRAFFAADVRVPLDRVERVAAVVDKVNWGSGPSEALRAHGLPALDELLGGGTCVDALRAKGSAMLEPIGVLFALAVATEAVHVVERFYPATPIKAYALCHHDPDTERACVPTECDEYLFGAHVVLDVVVTRKQMQYLRHAVVDHFCAAFPKDAELWARAFGGETTALRLPYAYDDVKCPTCCGGPRRAACHRCGGCGALHGDRFFAPCGTVPEGRLEEFQEHPMLATIAVPLETPITPGFNACDRPVPPEVLREEVAALERLFGWDKAGRMLDCMAKERRVDRDDVKLWRAVATVNRFKELWGTIVQDLPPAAHCVPLLDADPRFVAIAAELPKILADAFRCEAYRTELEVETATLVRKPGGEPQYIVVSVTGKARTLCWNKEPNDPKVGVVRPEYHTHSSVLFVLQRQQYGVVTQRCTSRRRDAQKRWNSVGNVNALACRDWEGKSHWIRSKGVEVQFRRFFFLPEEQTDEACREMVRKAKYNTKREHLLLGPTDTYGAILKMEKGVTHWSCGPVAVTAARYEAARKQTNPSWTW